jgi:hypothetical protein
MGEAQTLTVSGNSRWVPVLVWYSAPSGGVWSNQDRSGGHQCWSLYPPTSSPGCPFFYSSWMVKSQDVYTNMSWVCRIKFQTSPKEKTADSFLKVWNLDWKWSLEGRRGRHPIGSQLRVLGHLVSNPETSTLAGKQLFFFLNSPISNICFSK